MNCHSDTTAQRLFRSFMRFRQVFFHQRHIEGFKHSDLRVLFCLKRGRTPDNPQMKVSEVSKLLNVTSPTITQLVKGLEARGLVERHIDLTDRRVVWLRLTEEGEAITDKAVKAFLASMSEVVEYLGEEKSNQLVDLLSQVLAYLEERQSGGRHSLWSEE